MTTAPTTRPKSSRAWRRSTATSSSPPPRRGASARLLVLLTGGLAMVGLATCYWPVDLQRYRRWASPSRAFGGNAIAAYALGAMGARLLNMSLLERSGGEPISVHALFHDDDLLAALSPSSASLAYGLAFVLGCFLVVQVLDAPDIHIRA